MNTVYASDSIQQERLPVGLEVGRIYFESLDLLCKGGRCERSKQTLNQVKIGVRFHRAEISHFEINRLYAYVQQIICEGIHFWKKVHAYKINCLYRVVTGQGKPG